MPEHRWGQTVPLNEYAKTGQLPPVRFDESGWFLIRAVTDLPDNYRFAMTAPFYVEVGYERRISRRAVKFFVDWVHERARQFRSIEDPQSRLSQEDIDYLMGKLDQVAA